MYGKACSRSCDSIEKPVFGSAPWLPSHRSAYCWNVIRLAFGSMYAPRDMSASMCASHCSASRFWRSGKDLLFSVPSGPMYRAR